MGACGLFQRYRGSLSNARSPCCLRLYYECVLRCLPGAWKADHLAWEGSWQVCLPNKELGFSVFLSKRACPFIFRYAKEHHGRTERILSSVLLPLGNRFVRLRPKSTLSIVRTHVCRADKRMAEHVPPVDAIHVFSQRHGCAQSPNLARCDKSFHKLAKCQLQALLCCFCL